MSFISWSGPRSGAIATALRDWLETTFQFTRPFLSKDIGAGRTWGRDIAKTLEQCGFGILVLTPEKENLTSSWILFEAGALAIHPGQARVAPLLVDMAPSQLTQPLSEFQAICMTDGQPCGRMRSRKALFIGVRANCGDVRL